jgi:hypothetical protein
LKKNLSGLFPEHLFGPSEAELRSVLVVDPIFLSTHSDEIGTSRFLLIQNQGKIEALSLTGTVPAPPSNVRSKAGQILWIS